MSFHVKETEWFVVYIPWAWEFLNFWQNWTQAFWIKMKEMFDLLIHQDLTYFRNFLLYVYDQFLEECCDQWNASIFPCSCWVSLDDRNSFGKRNSFNEAFIISNLRASNSYAWRCGKIGDTTNKIFFRFPCAANKVLFVVRWFYIFLESSFHHFGHWGLSDYIFIFPRLEKSGLYAPWRQYFSILGLLTLTFEAMDYW